MDARFCPIFNDNIDNINDFKLTISKFLNTLNTGVIEIYTELVLFSCSQKKKSGEHIVAALSVRPSVRPSGHTDGHLLGTKIPNKCPSVRTFHSFR